MEIKQEWKTREGSKGGAAGEIFKTKAEAEDVRRQINFEKRENKLALRGWEGHDTLGGSSSTL